MPETRFTSFPALFVDPKVGIYRSASETNVLLFSLPMTLKIIIYHSSFLSFLTFILRQTSILFERHSVLLWWCKSEVISEVHSSDVTFNVVCGLSQPMGYTEYSSTAINRTNSVSKVRKSVSFTLEFFE